MRITPPPHILHHWAFKAAVIVSAFVSMPFFMRLVRGSLPTWKDMLMAWPWVFRQTPQSFMPLFLVFYTVGLISIICWWRKPSWRTATGLFFAIPFLCGFGGVYFIFFLGVCFSTR